MKKIFYIITALVLLGCQKTAPDPVDPSCDQWSNATNAFVSGIWTVSFPTAPPISFDRIYFNNGAATVYSGGSVIDNGPYFPVNCGFSVQINASSFGVSGGEFVIRNRSGNAMSGACMIQGYWYYFSAHKIS